MPCQFKLSHLNLYLAVAFALISQSAGAEVVKIEQTTVETSAPVARSQVVVEHAKSVMEPLAVQVTDGVNGKVVQPIIMERHDKLLDRTIYNTDAAGNLRTKTTILKENAAEPPQVIQKIEVR
jgi:hypothetical protein